MRVIDTHAHIYSPDEMQYPPREEPLRPPAGAGTLEHLAREMARHGVSAVCLIQTSSFYRFDNRFILDTSQGRPDGAAGVATPDPNDPSSPAELARWAREHGIRGIRSLPAADGRLDHPGVQALWRAANKLGLVVNLLIDPPQAAEAARLLDELPSLPVVLDHCLNLKLGPELEATLGELHELARRPNVHAKLSFVPSGSDVPFPCAAMQEPCLRVIRMFGPKRCVWGSAFPAELWTPKVSYGEHLRFFREVLPLEDGDRAEILGQTARRLWFPNLAW